jgi:nitrite reductase (NADH) small subunit
MVIEPFLAAGSPPGFPLPQQEIRTSLWIRRHREKRFWRLFMSVPLPSPITANLGSVDLIPMGQGRLFEVQGVPIAVFRSRDGSVFATQAACPHRGGPLADGILGQRTLVCPLHACGFDVGSGRPAGHTYGSLKVYPVSLNSKEQLIITLE